MKSCTMLAVQVDGLSATTVEGLKQNGQLHPIQAGVQGASRAAVRLLHAGDDAGLGSALIEENPSPTDEEVRWAISGNICRCTGYTTIVNAIQAAGETMAATRTEEMADHHHGAAHHRRDRGHRPLRPAQGGRPLRPGAGHYLDDIVLPGMLHMAILAARSPTPASSASTRREAQALDGVVAVVTGELMAAAQPGVDADPLG